MRTVAQCIEGRYAVINALPFHRAAAVAALCAKAGVHYFDLVRWLTGEAALRLRPAEL